MVKNLPFNAGDVGLIPGSGRSPKKETAPTPFLPGKSHGQKEPGGLRSMELQKSQTSLSD